MLSIHSELSARFPEIAENLYDCRELPYLQMHELANWITGLNAEQLSPEVVARIASFQAWAVRQPRTADSATDVYTIFVVGFLENLFAHERSRVLVPHLIPKEQMLENGAYLEQWVGKENYDAALSLYSA